MATLATASLSETERRVLERFVSVLESELGNELEAVWLYGSRARGERPHDESDVDVLVIVNDRQRHDTRVGELRNRATGAEGESEFHFSVIVTDPAWLAQRRAIDAFFVREVDRDRIVLAGDPRAGLERGGAPPPDGLVIGRMSLRSSEYIERARARLRMARLALDDDLPSESVGPSYFAMLYAARAALSELDLFAKTHDGTWTLFDQHFVKPGRFDAEVRAAATDSESRRIGSDYEARSYTTIEATTQLADAERFVDAVVAMFDARG